MFKLVKSSLIKGVWKKCIDRDALKTAKSIGEEIEWLS